MEQQVICDTQKNWATLELNRPQALNALTLSMIKQFHDCLNDWEGNTAIMAILVHTDHAKAYCAGGDIRFLYGDGNRPHPGQLEFFRKEYQLNYRMATSRKPIVTLVNGMAMGGGIGISLHASHPVATDKAVFAMPETAIGFFPDIGASYLLSKCPGALGLYLALTGRRFTAFDACRLGLVHSVVSQESLSDFTGALMASGGNPAMEIEKYCQKFTISEHQDSELWQQASRINRIFAAGTLEDIYAALAREEDDWCDKVIQDLDSRCPLSLKVTFEQFQRAKNKSLAQCLQMDYVLAANFMHSPDFYEGVRAMVIDKDRQPRWTRRTIADIRPQEVAGFFTSSESSLQLTPCDE